MTLSKTTSFRPSSSATIGSSLMTRAVSRSTWLCSSASAPLRNDDDVARTARRFHDPPEAGGQRKQRHEDHDDQRDAADGHGGGAFPHGDAAQAVGERDRHAHTLRSASVALSRMPVTAGTMPLTKPVSAARPTAASIDSSGR